MITVTTMRTFIIILAIVFLPVYIAVGIGCGVAIAFGNYGETFDFVWRKAGA